MTEQKKKLLKAKIAAALYHESGQVPSTAEIEKWTKLAQGALHRCVRTAF